MANTRPSAARLWTAAAALIVAAAVASCSSDRPAEIVPVSAGPTSTTSADTADDPSATTDPEPAPTLAAGTLTVATELSMTDIEATTTDTEAPTTDIEATTTDTEAPTTGAQATVIAVEPSASVAEPSPSTNAISAAAASWDFSPLADHLSYDAVNDARMQAPNPAVIRIPRLGVKASIIPLGLQDDGSIEIPEDPEQAGWWLGGPEPGETGPAVILGHVDSQEEGPAVFFDLRYMKAGDEIHIDRVDGSTVSYVVDFLESHDKDAFPTDAVYGPTEQPTLRLVTCGGDFDFNVRTYEENVIVFASLA